MIEILLQVVGWVFVLSGSFFVIGGSIGLVRLPDVYTRIHGVGVVDSLGAMLFLIGLGFFAGASLVTVKLLFIAVFIFFSAPTAINALANAAFSSGLKPLRTDGEDESSKR